MIINIRVNLKTCCILATDFDGWPGFDISSTNKMQLDNRKEVKKGQEIEEGRGPTEDIIHYFSLMSSELHYLDIILKIENLTLMSSASGKFDINVLSIWENHLSNTHIFVILPVLFLFSHILNASEQLQLLIYALLSLKCRELHLRVF